MNVNFARLNHILIPDTKAGRDRFRASRFGRLVGPVGWLYGALSEEGRVVFVTSMVVGGFGLDVQSSEVYLLWAIMAGLLVGSLALTRFHKLERVRVEVDAPRRVTLGDPITFSVVLHNDGDADLHALRVHGPFLPWDGEFVTQAPGVASVRAGSAARIEIGAQFVARGEHHLDPFTTTALVPLGLAQGPAVSSSGVKFLVVPRIARVVRLGTPPGARYQPGGVALASKTGESMDLLGVRPYRSGDPVRLLHARSWARTGSPVVREYQEEYFSRIGVIIDAAAPSPRVLEAILQLAAGAVAFLSRGEALIDLLVVGERVHDLTIGRHLGFLDQALDLLACVELAKQRTDPDALVRRLTSHLSRLSCVVVVTPSWDKGALADRIRSAGVACTTLIVGDASGAPGPDVRRVSVAAIEAGEPLVL